VYIGKTFSAKMIWHFAKENLLITLCISATATLLYTVLGWKQIAIPFLPVSTIGTAVAFYVGFKNNQAYNRLWEARRMWGGIINTSRSFAAMVLALIPDKKVHEDFLYRHIIYINTLRLQLRRTIPWATSQEDLHQVVVSESEELEQYEGAIVKLFAEYGKMDVYEQIKGKSNMASVALSYQVRMITKLKREKVLDEYEHSDLVKQITELYNLQGACERIKSTPLFRQYSIFSRIFVKLFTSLLPFALLTEMSKLGAWGVWLTIPFSLLVSWVFFTMEQIGEFSENPFDNSVNDTPMSTICRNIEIELLEMLGVTNLPPKIQPDNNTML